MLTLYLPIVVTAVSTRVYLSRFALVTSQDTNPMGNIFFFHLVTFCTRNLPCYEYQGAPIIPADIYQGSHNMSDSMLHTPLAPVTCPEHV
jgi:hypothetical protein